MVAPRRNPLLSRLLGLLTAAVILLDGDSAAAGAKSEVRLNKSPLSFPGSSPLPLHPCSSDPGSLFAVPAVGLVWKIDQGLLASIPLLPARRPESFARFRLDHLHDLRLQHYRSLFDNPDEHNIVFFDEGLEVCRHPRFRWRLQLLFFDGVHTHPRFDEDVLQLSLRRPSSPQFVRPFRIGSMRPWRLWHPTTPSTSSAPMKMMSSFQRCVYSSSPSLRRVVRYVSWDLVVIRPSLKDLCVNCAA
ncbi:hypothetical protein U9M48_035192 [Paspalum notatum var. saurae]|uniref:Uncharacterized protein n=1 Tax=Paspalum notatum var. saurae TaxID=547442 RepID=A0AAQ3X856_PASNO